MTGRFRNVGFRELKLRMRDGLVSTIGFECGTRTALAS